MEPIETFEHAGLVVHIYQDTDPESPRECDNAGRMVCWHRRYDLGDRNSKDRHPSADDGTIFETPDDFREWWEEHGKGGILLPLYLYDHSGITMRCSPFSCPWDSGQVGYIYVTADKIRKEWGKRITKAIRKHATDCLVQEVKTYDEWLTGQVYGYDVDEGEDSCWGFYGLDCCIEEAKGAAEAIRDNRTDAATESIIASIEGRAS